MPVLEMVDEKDAPKPVMVKPEVLAERQTYEDYIKSVAKTGRIGKLALDSDDELLSVRLKLSHAARRVEQPIEAWSVDRAIYFHVKHN